MIISPDNKVHGANMGPTWGRQDPGGPHVGPTSLAIWDLKIDLNLSFVEEGILLLLNSSKPFWITIIN